MIIKNKFKLLLMVFIMILALSSCSIIGFIFRDMDHLPEGELITSKDSPNGDYTINAYLCSGNATTDFSMRCSVKNNKENTERNIYWQYHEEEAEIIWIDDVTVDINGVKLNVETDSYDYRENSNENIQKNQASKK